MKRILADVQKNCSSAIIKRRNLSKPPNNQAAPNVNLNSIQTDGQLNQACNPKQDNDIVSTKRGNYHQKLLVLKATAH